ncbi:MAG: hypothetical protein K2O00_00220 [Muribaculaceae bacterium]|nr:hypothetical protein [Muribaculaceae bacterium]
MTKTLTLLLCSACFLMMLSSCLSTEQKMLKKDVEVLNQNLPAEVAGITIVTAAYDTETDIVTLELYAENSLSALAASKTPALVQQGLIVYLKSTDWGSDFLTSVRKANVTLKCPCYDESDNEIITLNIPPEDL